MTKWYTVQEAKNLPKPEWLIEGIVHEQEICMLWGDENVGKTFLSLDWALCVATGTPWLKKVPVKQTDVWYLYLEGIRGAADRIEAWEFAYTRDAGENNQFMMADDPDQIKNMTVPGLLIVDTMNMAFPGSNSDDLRAKEVMKVLRDLTKQGFTVIIVHHSRKHGKDTSPDPMGSMVYRGDVDASFHLVERSNQWTLSCKKQRNAEKIGDIHLSRQKFVGSLVYREQKVVMA